METKKITYFDNTNKLLQNLENCAVKEIDMDFVQESLKTIINILQAQNSFLEYLVEIDDSMELVSNDKQIIKGMICFIRGNKQFGKIIEIDEENNIYTLKILGTNQNLKVTKKHFNI